MLTKINGEGEKMEKNKPVHSIRAGALQVNVWENIAQPKVGNAFKSYSVTFKRGYKNDKGEWQDTDSLRANDIPKLQLLLNKAYEYLITGAGKEEKDE